MDQFYLYTGVVDGNFDREELLAVAISIISGLITTTICSIDR